MDIISSYFIICVVCFPSLVVGTVTVSFDPVKTPLTNSVDITCTLTGSSTNAVTWSFGSTITSCGSGSCLPDPSPHTFSMSGNVYTLTLPSAAITNCISYSCADAVISADTISEDLFVSYFDKTDIVPTEPGANSDGTISVTTGCVLSPSDLTITWSKIQGGVEVTFTPDHPINTSDRSTCTRTCHSEEDEKVTNGFNHTEYTGDNFVVVQYQVNVSHKSYPDAADLYTWTSASYKIEADCKCECDCECRTIVIVSMVFGIFGALGLLIIVVGIPAGCLNERETLLLTSGVIGIVFDVLSLVLSIVVKVKECCKENCEDSECCEEDSECCKDWIDNAAIAFIVIPCVAVVVSVIIFVLVKLDIIGPGSNGITKQDLRPLEETVCKKLLRVLESAYPKILLVKDLIRKVDAEETVVMEQLEELKRKDLIRQLDSGGFVRHFLDVKTGITKQDLRPLEEIVCEKLLRVLESVYPNILSVKDLIRIDFAEESVVMEQLEELRRKDLIKQLDSGGFVRHFLDVKTAYKAKEAKEPGENDRLMETSN